jgi:F-type H+-transporting ATPase subunit delta
MAELDPKSRKLAKRLAVLTVQAGDSAPTEVKAALEKLVGDRPLAERRSFIKAYLRYLEREFAAQQLVVEHAGPLTEEAVREVAVAFAAQTGRRFTVVTRENPELIGGLRLINGDNVYDASIAGRLSRLAASV